MGKHCINSQCFKEKNNKVKFLISSILIKNNNLILIVFRITTKNRNEI